MTKINRSISVHLQDFPDVGFLNDEDELIRAMDLVRNICSSALSIRDNKNLRVRLPLQGLTIIGKDAKKLLDFKDIIAEEVNVKEIFTREDVAEFSEIKLQINFKKIGAKYGAKMKEITEATRTGNWQKLNDKSIQIAGIDLVADEFDLKLAIKNYDESKFSVIALPSNDYLVMLDIQISEKLEHEGIARDIVRAIQQNRKEADLDISRQIILKIYSSNPIISKVAQDFAEYIKKQVLTSNLEVLDQKPSSTKFYFQHQLDYGDLTIVFS